MSVYDANPIFFNKKKLDVQNIRYPPPPYVR